uniref:Uncharacterized protein n=1 Tax=Cannabis sativa TaxID=3483 RepID=A0A803Q884_CANSA
MGYSQGFQTHAPSGSQRGYNQGGGYGASTNHPSKGKGKEKAKSSAPAYAFWVDDVQGGADQRVVDDNWRVLTRVTPSNSHDEEGLGGFGTTSDQ